MGARLGGLVEPSSSASTAATAAASAASQEAAQALSAPSATHAATSVANPGSGARMMVAAMRVGSCQP